MMTEQRSAGTWQWLVRAAASPETRVPDGSGGVAPSLASPEPAPARASADVVMANTRVSSEGSPGPQYSCACSGISWIRHHSQRAAAWIRQPELHAGAGLSVLSL
jgi:hypothetical protein